ncbi:thiol:disulfide interchange protein DsbA/DsbL [Edwardsiella piscicida]|uniref:Thiol:disulfide interchange protein DsbL n=4 Tax=Edwardsiella TaxID=635 RepID=A0A0H3DMR2_EDWTF|nr:thiol:disulfide interchange protein DsbA/DsbL [Edwardsiella piscicida]ACY83370.1 disulfide isomerase [Edwardsiella tarda EIB202]ADM40598.1 DsbA-like Periplasmic thiol:disulfide interchange protein [Edwardsiella tarda FL6-60]AGH72641.1 DsbA-like Periplasmic thiol:disulfide interchange protein [Edwardsiella piscicida C07-087]AOP42028.1 thiol:disulfide interchange protein DsbA/DsbL [Edwardsiella piscicida]ARD17826.1 thiol:disulfide interchange protein [Edwardsiella piscicida]
MHLTLGKTHLKALLGATLLTCAFGAAAFSEGTDYVVLEKPIPNAQKTLIKVFSYDCPFCYKYDKAVTGPVSDKVKDIVRFEPYHLDTKGVYGPQGSEILAVLLNKDRAAGVSIFDDASQFKKAKFAYYAAYHDKKERWKDGKDPAAFTQTGLDAAGLSQADLEGGLKDPAVQKTLGEWKASAYDVAKIQGVPAYVVNGKYLIMTKSIKSVDSMADLVKELAAK